MPSNVLPRRRARRKYATRARNTKATPDLFRVLKVMVEQSPNERVRAWLARLLRDGESAEG
jgi:hypothetical protein